MITRAYYTDPNARRLVTGARLAAAAATMPIIILVSYLAGVGWRMNAVAWALLAAVAGLTAKAVTNLVRASSAEARAPEQAEPQADATGVVLVKQRVPAQTAAPDAPPALKDRASAPDGAR